MSPFFWRIKFIAEIIVRNVTWVKKSQCKGRTREGGKLSDRSSTKRMHAMHDLTNFLFFFEIQASLIVVSPFISAKICENNFTNVGPNLLEHMPAAC